MLSWRTSAGEPQTRSRSMDTKFVAHEIRVIREVARPMSVSKRNVTITLDESVARWARVRAAERDTSVSSFVGELLRERMVEEETYEAAMQEYLSGAPRTLKPAGAQYPPREELHERHRLR